MTDPKRLDAMDLYERAARGVGKVDAHGALGVTNCSHNEIEAMALMLGILNFPAIAPGEDIDDLTAFFRAGFAKMITAPINDSQEAA